MTLHRGSHPRPCWNYAAAHLNGGVDVHGLRGRGDGGGLLIGLGGGFYLLRHLHRLLLSVRHAAVF